MTRIIEHANFQIEFDADKHVYCACGCGGKLPARDKKGRPRRFKMNHDKRKPLTLRETSTGCWLLPHRPGTNGYVIVCRDGEVSISAHRWAYEGFWGPIEDGLALDHLCRNPACVNPWHLEPVTDAENCRRGARTRLTAEDASTIRESTDGTAALAVRFGISHTHVRAIQRGLRWAS